MQDMKKDRVFAAQMKLASYDWPDQDPFIQEWTERVLNAHYTNQALRTGQHLYCMLPKEFRSALNGKLHDPFYSSMEKGEIIHWFIRHITFNEEGKMVILRDYERALEFIGEVPS